MKNKGLEHTLYEIDSQILQLSRKKIECLKKASDAILKTSGNQLKQLSHALDYTGLPRDISLEFIQTLFEKGVKPVKPKVALLGPDGTFSHCAANVYFGENMVPLFMKNFNAIFESMTREADLAIIPVENSIEGAVSLNLDLLIESPFFVTGEIILPIDHQLMSFGAFKDLRAVYSHPQILAQCRKWLEQNMPQAKIFETSSSAAAVQFVQKQKHHAMIGNRMISELYNIPVLKEHIHDDNTNQTRFWVLSREKNPLGRCNKTSIVFLCDDKPGSLLDVLKVFKTRNINLTRIESRPSKRKVWEYYFFVDLTGDENSPEVRSALKTLRTKTSYLKVLGSYTVSVIHRQDRKRR